MAFLFCILTCIDPLLLKIILAFFQNSDLIKMCYTGTWKSTTSLICLLDTVYIIHWMQVEDAETIVKLTEEMDSIDAALLEEAISVIKELNKALERFELTQLLSSPYDKEGAVISITAGAGGTDAQVIVFFFFVRQHERYKFLSHQIKE